MSGPAAGAIAAAQIALAAGLPNVVSCDMGGTSFDVALIWDGAPSASAEKDIEYSVPVRVPMIDVHTIGAGGGSIARLDAGGLLKVGPESAVATPGPICYGRGGVRPTVTDANLLLGRVDPSSMPGVRSGMAVEQVAAAFADQIGRQLGLDAHQAAAAVISVANHNMAAAIRQKSVAVGRDPRDFALFAYGGAGPLHAIALARELGVSTVLAPRFPGITSALGCCIADVRATMCDIFGRPLDGEAAAEIDAIFLEQKETGLTELLRKSIDVDSIEVVHEGGPHT